MAQGWTLAAPFCVDGSTATGLHDVRAFSPPGAPAQALEQHNDTLASFMRAQGLVMQPRWCGNGSLVPAAWATSPIDPLWGPQWMADTVEEAVAGLLNATALAPAQLATKARRFCRGRVCCRPHGAS